MTALADYLAAWPRRFDWASAHCGHFAFGWINAATGRDALAVLPSASTDREWARLLHRSGGMARLASHLLRCAPYSPAIARPGDVLLFAGRMTGGALGIRLHAGAAVLGADGAVRVVSDQGALAAWPLAEVLPEVPA